MYSCIRSNIDSIHVTNIHITGDTPCRCIGVLVCMYVLLTLRVLVPRVLCIHVLSAYTT
jgi:hypothetical protein